MLSSIPQSFLMFAGDDDNMRFAGGLRSTGQAVMLLEADWKFGGFSSSQARLSQWVFIP
jgi:hypothetical protein